MTDLAREGRIVSFYSFKGGVGRTMALANVAFLAAMNGLNVLVMDWDLEAPGLHHYFRGIVESSDMAALREAEGVLDIAWEWRNRIEVAEGRDDVDAIFETFRQGEPFARRLKSVWISDEFGDEGRIDIIPAGAPNVATPDLIEYERALACFSWSDFLDRYAGGGMIDALRKWSSSLYDLVLVDSRTGLADVAGICTMQLPDAVVLAFVLNRQNIEGAARVAGAIRQVRGDDLRIWPVPMRVSREGTAEEADASARALREFIRVAGLDKEQTERDMRGLLVKAEPNVPFMESLAPFNDTDAALDPLTANMARLTKEITGVEIGIPIIASAWRDQVHSRLAPSLSTEAYLRQLMNAEPLRAVRELHRFVESALSTVSDGEQLSDEYVIALVETSFALHQRSDNVVDDSYYDTPSRVLLLLRRLYESDHERWRGPFVNALQFSLDTRFGMFSVEDELVTLEEIDELLAGEEQTAAVLLQRAENRLRIARLFNGPDEGSQKLAAADDTILQVNKARKVLGDEDENLQILRFEAVYLRGDALVMLEHDEAAEQAFKRVVNAMEPLIVSSSRPEPTRLAFDANYRLMRLVSSTDSAAAATYATAAIVLGNPAVGPFLSRAAEFAEVLLHGPDARSDAQFLLRRLVSPPASPRTVAHFFSRGARTAFNFIDALGKLIATASSAPSDDLAHLTELAVTIVREMLGDAERRMMSGPTAGSLRSSRTGVQSVALLADAVVGFASILSGIKTLSGLEESVSELSAIATHLSRVQRQRMSEDRRRAKFPEEP